MADSAMQAPAPMMFGHGRPLPGAAEVIALYQTWLAALPAGLDTQQRRS